MSEKKEPSLEDLGLDQPANVSSSEPGKISIRSLQLESENESLATSGRTVATAVQPVASENVLGVVGFVLSVVGLISIGCISPVSLVVCFFALGKKPVGLAVAGLILSVIGCIGMVVAVIGYAAGLFVI